MRCHGLAWTRAGGPEPRPGLSTGWAQPGPRDYGYHGFTSVQFDIDEGGYASHHGLGGGSSSQTPPFGLVPSLSAPRPLPSVPLRPGSQKKHSLRSRRRPPIYITSPSFPFPTGSSFLSSSSKPSKLPFSPPLQSFSSVNFFNVQFNTLSCLDPTTNR